MELNIVPVHTPSGARGIDAPGAGQHFEHGQRDHTHSLSRLDRDRLGKNAGTSGHSKERASPSALPRLQVPLHRAQTRPGEVDKAGGGNPAADPPKSTDGPLMAPAANTALLMVRSPASGQGIDAGAGYRRRTRTETWAPALGLPPAYRPVLLRPMQFFRIWRL